MCPRDQPKGFAFIDATPEMAEARVDNSRLKGGGVVFRGDASKTPVSDLKLSRSWPWR
jgi:hypothetical protein